MILRDALAHFTSAAIGRSEVRLLAAHALQRDAAWLVSHDTDALSATQFETIQSLVSRRRAGEPIAYIVGYREFYGRRFKTTPAALIPRPETELLIDEVCALVRETPTSHNEAARILDVGTGTGCIAITLALENDNVDLTASDLSRDALALAQDNANALTATKLQFIESDWFSAIDANKKFDIIVSNPPYIAPNDPHLFKGDLRFEPWLALRDRVDGLESYRELVRGAKKHLREGGTLIVEHGYDQGESVPALFREAGFADVEMIRDFAGNARVTRGRFSSHLSSL
jgi:release factor glutamine methyltransferase